jgi:hypothetical protein
MIFLNELIQSLFIGFGIFVFATSFINVKTDKGNALITNLTDSASIIISWAAIGYLLIWVIGLYTIFQSEDEYYSLRTRLTGPYWFGYWIYPACFGLFPQLLWWKKIREVKAIRIVTAFLFLFALYIEKIVILITSFHRDYIPSGWTMLPGYFVIYDWFASIIIFSLVVGAAHFMKLKFKKDTF